MESIGYPFRPYHPGELVKEELECRRISQRQFAHTFGVSYTMLNEILNGKRPLSTDFALLLEAALGIDADLLVRMQMSYDMQVARQDKKRSLRINEIKKLAASLL
ncbi:MAG: HigA family addiction module antidote protein [Prevotellaceae bacterium]|jgi:addiction module HigA family antidote|nr:HigA family addiction module antidote protein [Prevotellaceae bacterium]